MNELEITISPTPDGSNWTISCGAIVGYAQKGFDDNALELIRTKIESGAMNSQVFRDHATLDTSVGAFLEKQGQQLFDLIFKIPGIQKKWRSMGPRGRFRLRLRSDDPRVAAHPWELLFDSELKGGQHICCLPTLTVVRSGSEDLDEPLTPIDLPLRLLLVAACPKELKKLDVEGEIAEIERALLLPELVEIDKVSGKDTWAQLGPRLAQERLPHIVHFICHGGFDPQEQEGFLCFENRDGGEHRFSASQLRAQFAGRVQQLRLVYLNCCVGNKGDENRAMTAVAPALFRLGVPAVVAMQNRISDPAAIVFARDFYSRLILGQPVDEAVVEARLNLRTVHSRPPTPEWATPVLYLAARDGAILNHQVDPNLMFEHAVKLLREHRPDDTVRMAEAFALQMNPKLGERFRRLSTLAAALKALRGSLEHSVASHERGEVGLCEEALLELPKLAGAVDRATLTEMLGRETDWWTLLDIADAIQAGEWEKVAAASAPKTDADSLRWRGARVGEVGLSDESWQRFTKLVREKQVDVEKWQSAEEEWRGGFWTDARARIAEALRTCPTPPGGKARWENRLARLDQFGTAQDLLFGGEAAVPVETLAQVETLLGTSGDDSPSGLDTARRLVQVARAAAEASATGAEAGATGRWENEIAALAEQPLRSGRGRDWPARTLEIVKAHLSRARATQAMTLYQNDRFAEAEGVFRDLGQETEAELCGQWSNLMEHLAAERWSEGQTALRTLEARLRLHSRMPHPDTGRWRRWVRRGSGVIRALRSMNGARWIAAPGLRADGRISPYLTLAAAGFSPAWSISKCSELGIDLQAKTGGMTTEEREAWDILRTAERRLRVDFGLYAVDVPRDYSAAIERALKGPALCTDDFLTGELKQDVSIFRALEPSYRVATDLFLETARRDPLGRTAWHHLGLAAAEWIEQLHGNDDLPNEAELREAWNRLIMGWGAIFGGSKQDFWHQWWIDRREAYGVPLTRRAITEAKQQLENEWLNRSAADEADCPGIHIRLSVEIQGARALADGGGLPLPDGRKVSLGPAALQFAGLAPALSEWARSFDWRRTEADHWETRVLRYFSTLAEAEALRDLGRPAEALAALDRAKPECAANPAANPAFARLLQPSDNFLWQRKGLAEDCHRQLASAALEAVPVRGDEAFEHWEKLVECARGRGPAAAQQVSKEIGSLAAGRARFLVDQETPKDRRETLAGMIGLLQRLMDQPWQLEPVVRPALVKTLLEYAMHLSNTFDDETGARRAAMEAYQLEPETLGSLIVIIISSLHLANECWQFRRKQEAEALLNEVETQWLVEGDRLFPGSQQIAELRKRLAEVREAHASGGENSLHEVLKEIESLAPPVSARSQRFKDALFERSQSRFRVAADLYRQLIDEDAEDREAREQLTTTLRGWLTQIEASTPISREEIEEVRQIYRKYCSKVRSADDLRELFEE